MVACSLIGCSGWSYRWWKGNFYPSEVRPKDYLAFYSRFFKAVEVNVTFYRFPTPHSIKVWRSNTPDDFTFAVKMNRGITHYRKLKDVEKTVYSFIGALEGLGKKLGPILVQLPPDLKPDERLLEDFLSILPSRPFAVEFRDRDWLRSDIFRILDAYSIAAVMTDPPPPKALPVTADFAYVRWHGRSGAGYEYDEQELEDWARVLSSINAKCLYGFFNNDQGGAAPRNAAAMNDLLARQERVGLPV